MSVFLVEVLAQKIMLDQKIREVKSMLSATQTDELVQEYFALLELLQSKLLHIEMANNVSTINIGGQDVTIAVAIQFRKTIKEKIDLITSLIDDPECRLDKLNLQKQRDQYHNDYVLLTIGITKNDLSVTVD